MSDRPIIFSGPMVRAILAGRKTQTRRVLGNVPSAPQPNCHPRHKQKFPAPYLDAWCGDRKTVANPRGMSPWWLWWQVDDRIASAQFKVGFVPGDRLWVREAFATDGTLVRYYATDDVLDLRRKRSPIHMPRWASRLTLIVEDVRVQRVQEISEEDARAEGARVTWSGDMNEGPSKWADENFADLWNEINAKRGYGWDTNPWVVALTFRAIQKNIDEVKADE